jgi:hypothetical protein
MDVDGISLSLTRDEALVLFEWLAKCDSTDFLGCEDHAEEIVLSRLHAQLEKLLVEPSHRGIERCSKRRGNECERASDRPTPCRGTGFRLPRGAQLFQNTHTPPSPSTLNRSPMKSS